MISMMLCYYLPIKDINIRVCIQAIKKSMLLHIFSFDIFSLELTLKHEFPDYGASFIDISASLRVF